MRAVNWLFLASEGAFGALKSGSKLLDVLNLPRRDPLAAFLPLNIFELVLLLSITDQRFDRLLMLLLLRVVVTGALVLQRLGSVGCQMIGMFWMMVVMMVLSLFAGGEVGVEYDRAQLLVIFCQ